ncbi:MAG: hypothetical protein E6I86_02170 [Chloroflexi bacterium]|nr:MAG: hypothetical protein E6I86_02170 [Chloroflexota bacterium]
MAQNERIPVDFHQGMFRIAAIAFVTAATVDVGSSFIGAPHLDFGGIWIVGILSYVGAAVSWFFPWHRLPVERFLVVIVRAARTPTSCRSLSRRRSSWQRPTGFAPEAPSPC